jgi:crossover junction endodeoxyribonuclease RusA
VTIFYFPNAGISAGMQGDIDNIIKSIRDRMKHVVYPDDGVVERVLAQRFEPGLLWEIQTQSPQILNALGTTPPLVYIRVDDDLSWRLVS